MSPPIKMSKNKKKEKDNCDEDYVDEDDWGLDEGDKEE